MGCEIILLGEEISQDDFQSYGEENVVVRGNIAIVNLKNSTLAHRFSQEMKRIGKYEVLSLEEYEGIMKSETKEYENLESIEYRECIDWQFEGHENFLVMNDNTLSVWDVDNDNVIKEEDGAVTGSVVLSSNGLFIANYVGNNLVLYTGKNRKIFNDLEFKEDISKVEFNDTDTFILVYTSLRTYLVEVYTGEIKKEISESSCSFDITGEYVIVDSSIRVNTATLEEDKLPEDMEKIRVRHGQMMMYSNDRVQRIFYESKLGTQKKTLANVTHVDFIFSKNRAYALMTKSIKGGVSYSLETFSHDLITINNIESEIKKIKVSDESFVTYDANKNVTFYKLDKYNFRKIKQIQKEDDVVISVSGSIFCIFDGEHDNVEFYDGGELRSVYSHQGCTNIIWSETGLYCASISRSTGLTQLYNSNGKLFWKKIFNRILNFQWRPFYKLNKEEKELARNYDIGEYKKPFDTSATTESNLDELISEWKSFLIEKKQLFLKI